MDDLYATLQPVMGAVGLELVDVELRSGVLLVTVDRDGGVDLDALTEANRSASAALDELDPIPGRYALEVSSPGVERTLRTPAHFSRAVGETVTVKTRPQVAGDRRLRGRLLAADDGGFDLAVEGADEPLRLAYGDIDRARTVFEWGGAPRPGARDRDGDRSRTTTAGRKKRKQVASR
ncbi:MAG TPA: ribosome maturation factor RimP [Acidimicrobiales bacterium]|jgi:ribosome maturation factor RimP|nr:ribosome maturation factor RimP [Acidimicrobiales bacterium]